MKKVEIKEVLGQGEEQVEGKGGHTFTQYNWMINANVNGGPIDNLWLQTNSGKEAKTVEAGATVMTDDPRKFKDKQGNWRDCYKIPTPDYSEKSFKGGGSDASIRAAVAMKAATEIKAAELSYLKPTGYSVDQEGDIAQVCKWANQICRELIALEGLQK